MGTISFLSIQDSSLDMVDESSLESVKKNMKKNKSVMMLLCICFLLLEKVSAASSTDPTSVAHKLQFDIACKEILASETAFSNFRCSPFCLAIIDTCSASQGMQFVEIISNYYPHLMYNLEQFRENDRIGNPIIKRFHTLGPFCPATLRYIKIAGDLEALFGSLNEKTIVEIGGGYGGQCRILSTLFSFKEYIIIDLPEVLNLARKYLDQLGVKNVRYLTPDQVLPNMSCDLVISNYAFSECFYKAQVEYMEKIIKHAGCGYMICNELGDLKGDAFKELFRASGIDFQVSPEIPQTGDLNYLITWK